MHRREGIVNMHDVRLLQLNIWLSVCYWMWRCMVW